MAPEATVQSDQNNDVPRLENLTLSQRAHTFLRDEILSNRLPPGTELQEVALSQQLGVSRGPIREALGRLAAEGLVTVRPRRGAVVHSLSSGEFLEAYQVREALEVLAVRLAVPRLGPEGLAQLQALTDTMASQGASGQVNIRPAIGEREAPGGLPPADRPDAPLLEALPRSARRSSPLRLRTSRDPARGA